MAYEREQAIGKFEVLKKQVYELGIKANALIDSIREETDTFINENDFSTMDFQKVESLAKDLQAIQKDYSAKKGKMEEIKKTYNIN